MTGTACACRISVLWVNVVRGDEKGVGNQYVSDAKCIIAPKNRVRRLTPLECERLQGFPDGWTDIPGASDTARYKALGNSVAGAVC